MTSFLVEYEGRIAISRYLEDIIFFELRFARRKYRVRERFSEATQIIGYVQNDVVLQFPTSSVHFWTRPGGQVLQRAIHKEKGKQPAIGRWASSVVREKVSSLVIAESSAVHGSYRV